MSKEWKRTPNYKCVVCNNDMYVRPSAIKKSSGWGFSCSKECGKINRAKHTKGISNHQFGLKGAKNSSFTGVEKINQYGYRLIYMPEHNRANHAGYIYEHNLIMERHIKRELKFYGYKNPKNEICHHIDRNKLNNDISNLQLMSEREHFKLHKLEDNYSLRAGKSKSAINQNDADLIRCEYKHTVVTQKYLAKKYNVSQGVISNIINKKRICYGKQM